MIKKKLRVVRERFAEHDLLEQIDYISKDSVSVALRYVDAVECSFERLSEMPEIGSLCDFQNPELVGVRMWPVKGFEKYLIFYQVTDERIEVIRVLHAARDIENIIEC